MAQFLSVPGMHSSLMIQQDDVCQFGCKHVETFHADIDGDIDSISRWKVWER